MCCLFTSSNSLWKRSERATNGIGARRFGSVVPRHPPLSFILQHCKCDRCNLQWVNLPLSLAIFTNKYEFLAHRIWLSHPSSSWQLVDAIKNTQFNILNLQSISMFKKQTNNGTVLQRFGLVPSYWLVILPIQCAICD